MRFSLLNTSRLGTYHTRIMLLKILLFIQFLCQSRLCKADHMLLILCYNDSWVTRRASYIFYVRLLLVLCCEHVHSYDFVWLLLVACTILSHTQTLYHWRFAANQFFVAPNPWSHVIIVLTEHPLWREAVGVIATEPLTSSGCFIIASFGVVA
jgi:hypothetical protein